MSFSDEELKEMIYNIVSIVPSGSHGMDKDDFKKRVNNLTDQLDNIKKGIQNLPNIEVSYLQEKLKDSGNIPTAKEAAAMLTINRYSNKICNTCHYKTDISKLKVCSKCHLIFYCSRDCQLKDWGKHKVWCSKKDTPYLEMGPNMTIVCHNNNNVTENGHTTVFTDKNTKMV